MFDIFAGLPPCTAEEAVTKDITFFVAITLALAILVSTVLVAKKQYSAGKKVSSVILVIGGLISSIITYFYIGIFYTPWCS